MFYLLGQALILPHQPLNNTTQLHEPIPRQAIFFKQKIPECFLKCVFFSNCVFTSPLFCGYEIGNYLTFFFFFYINPDAVLQTNGSI